MSKLSDRGFSLIELMIVVAIIGILSSMAVPSYQRYQGKAKQAQAKTLLGAYYMSQKAFFAEFNFYPGQFGMSGYSLEGKINYRILAKDNGAAMATYLPPAMNVPACVTTFNPGANCTATAFGGNLPVWTEESSAATPLTVPSTTATGFVALAAANYNGINNDEWQIDESNTVTNLTFGL